MYVIPIRQTPDPDRGGYLPEAGRNVEPSPYWLRRVAEGDVRKGDPPPEPAPATPDESPPRAGSSTSTSRRAQRTAP